MYDAIESGVADVDDPDLKERMASLKAARDQAREDAARVTSALDAADSGGVGEEMLAKFAEVARQRMRTSGGRYRRDHLRALAQRVGVDDGIVRIMGNREDLLQALVASSGSATDDVPIFVAKWCAREDSNLRPPD